MLQSRSQFKFENVILKLRPIDPWGDLEPQQKGRLEKAKQQGNMYLRNCEKFRAKVNQAP